MGRNALCKCIGFRVPILRAHSEHTLRSLREHSPHRRSACTSHGPAILIQDAAKPVSELTFPSVTICAPGLNMEAVKEALLNDFDRWLETERDVDSSYQEQLEAFMEEKYSRKLGEGSIFEQIKAMNSPPSSEDEGCKSCSAGLQTLAACRETDATTRRKRSNAGQGSR